jgi:hypothetical protein
MLKGTTKVSDALPLEGDTTNVFSSSILQDKQPLHTKPAGPTEPP